MLKKYCEIFYIEYIGSNKANTLINGNIYKVVDIIENYYYKIMDYSNVELIVEPHLTKIFPILKVKIDENIKKQNEKMDQRYVFTLNDLLLNKVYDVISIETGFKKDDTYRIIDESEEDYMYPKEIFEIVEDNRKIIENIKSPTSHNKR